MSTKGRYRSPTKGLQAGISRVEQDRRRLVAALLVAAAQIDPSRRVNATELANWAGVSRPTLYKDVAQLVRHAPLLVLRPGGRPPKGESIGQQLAEQVRLVEGS